MKIDQSLKTIATPKSKDIQGGRSRTLTRQSTPDRVQDQVDLTGDAARLRELEARLAELDSANPGKIEAIRQALADGSFKVDTEAVADGMIRETLDLLSRMNR
ncbi:MAG: flagellar biosynthesis anti-sigma factor FlgM [Pseudomonadota bacterium]